MAISFDGPNKVMTLLTGTITLSVRDVWSRWVDWFLTSDNSKYLPAFQQVGGDDIDVSAGTKIPIYIFLLNGWKISPQSANHTLAVEDGILLVYGGGDPFNDSSGYTVRINYQQPVQAIAFGGGLTQEENAQLMSLPNVNDIWADETPMFMLKTIKNKKRLYKDGSVWKLLIYDDNDSYPILSKELKDKDGNNITDLVAGTLAQELKTSV